MDRKREGGISVNNIIGTVYLSRKLSIQQKSNDNIYLFFLNFSNLLEHRTPLTIISFYCTKNQNLHRNLRIRSPPSWHVFNFIHFFPETTTSKGIGRKSNDDISRSGLAVGGTYLYHPKRKPKTKNTSWYQLCLSVIK